jgi:16S rRNA C1402 (ribose-2'-O) methylase RsmI
MLVIGGHRQNDARWSEEELLTELQARLEAGQPAKEIARALAAESGWPRREIYSLAVDSGRSPA